MTIESTTRIVHVNGVEARVWEGESAGGIPVVAVIVRVAAPEAADLAEFDRELKERRPASDAGMTAFPARMIL